VRDRQARKTYESSGGQAAQLDERYTTEIEPLYGSINLPVLILWGERLHDAIAGPRPCTIPEAGHFAMEDPPEAIAAALDEFFALDWTVG
jgi:pimeloyl-ACP methyl ester carboxylesterase